MKIKLLFSAIIISTGVFAQTKVLPNQMLPEEVPKIDAYNANRSSTGIVIPI